MNPKKIYLAAGGVAGGSHWCEPQPVRRENGAADGGEYFLELGLQRKKTGLTKMVVDVDCLCGLKRVFWQIV